MENYQDKYLRVCTQKPKRNPEKQHNKLIKRCILKMNKSNCKVKDTRTAIPKMPQICVCSALQNATAMQADPFSENIDLYQHTTVAPLKNINRL